jgi:alpha-beta hydrolase superfamily lysophospholipase
MDTPMDTFTTADGSSLHLQRWPAVGPAHGTVQIVHGLGEHMGRYAAVAAALNAAGWHVAGHDHRGHGRSAGPRGGMPADDTLLADLAAVTDHLRGPGRHVLLGHSMGGLVAARFVAEALAPAPAAWCRQVDGLVMSSPALDAGLGAVQKLLLAVLGRLAPDLRVPNGLNAAWVSRDAEVVKAYLADPLVHDRVTPRLVRFIVDAGEQVLAVAPKWQVPTLLMWAGADRCVAPAGSAVFSAAAPPAVVRAHLLPGLYHEIFNEPEREHVLAHLLQWLASAPWALHVTPAR